MATVTSVKGYKNGESSNSTYIGAYQGSIYERVYGIEIGNTGATQIVLTLQCTSRYGGEQNAIINGTESCYTTAISQTGTRGVYNASALTLTFTIDGEWLPGQVVYVHIFPSGTGNVFYCNAAYNVGTLTAQDVGVYGGLVRVNTGSGFVMCIPYVRTGGAWKQCLAYIRNGSWKMGV